MQFDVARLRSQAERLHTGVRESAGALVGTVHIDVLPSTSRQLVPSLFSRISAVAPAVRLHVTEGFSGDLDAQIMSGRLDTITVNRYGVAAAREEDVLGIVDVFLVGRPNKMSLEDATISFRHLGGLPLALPSTPNGLRSTLDHMELRSTS